MSSARASRAWLSIVRLEQARIEANRLRRNIFCAATRRKTACDPAADFADRFRPVFVAHRRALGPGRQTRPPVGGRSRARIVLYADEVVLGRSIEKRHIEPIAACIAVRLAARFGGFLG